MKTFSRLSSFTLVFLGLALLLFTNTSFVYAQVSTLEIGGATGINEPKQVGQPVETTFVATDGGSAAEGIMLDITSSKGIMGIPVSEITNLVGRVTVNGTITKEAYTLPLNSQGFHEVTITARWDEKDKEVKQVFLIEPPSGVAPAVIVVNPPNPKSPLAVGDSFMQTITIENQDSDWRTLRLSAWQMDIVFNPAILEVVNVMEGDFLESNGDNALFYEHKSKGRVSVSQALAGNAAGQATAPSPSGISLAPGDNGTLLTIEFKVLAFAEEALGIHNILLQSDEDRDEDGTPDRISYGILIKDVFVTTVHQTYIYEKEDVNQDEMVDILDLMVVASSIGTQNPRADVNGDGFVNVLDLVLIYTSSLWGGPAPATLDQSFTRSVNNPPPLAPQQSRNVDPTTIQSWIDQAQLEDDGSAIFERGITNLETLLNSSVPTKTRLLLNYPNPFNPETWIPYQLAEASNVTLSIYTVNGKPIRTLSIGHQSAGTYISKSRAAYWDGHNEFGEKAASGLYFYTFTAGKFSATGKMLILK